MYSTWPFGSRNVKSGIDRAALDRGLLLVVDVLDEAGEPQHVFGHALAPLAPRLAAGERLAQALVVSASERVVVAWNSSCSLNRPSDTAFDAAEIAEL